MSSVLLILKSVKQKLNNGYFIMKFVLLPGLVTIFSYQCLLLCWWWTHWHEIPSFPRLWLAYPLSLSPLQLRNKLKAAPSLLYPAEWKFIYDVSSFTFQTPAMTWPLVTKCHEVCQCLCCMDDDTQTAQWWGLMVYVSAVGSAASAWAGRVSITFITFVGWEMLDWFWIGTHSYTLTSFIKPKPLGLLHCHWLPDIHHANTSPTYYIRYHMSREHDTAYDNGHCLTPHW